MASLLERLRIKLSWLMVVTIITPTFLSIMYFGLVASDVYISESRFVVRSPDKQTPSGLGVLLKSAGFSNSADEVVVAKAFLDSRDALRALNRNGAFSSQYSSSTISMVDRFAPFGLFDSFEDLYRYYQSKVSIEADTSTSISTLTVRAYSAPTARQFNEQLLEMAEATVNKLNERGRQDLISFADAEVIGAKQKASSTALALSVYRNREGVVDPEKQANVQMQMISKLQDELIASKTQLIQLRTFAAENPQVPVLATKVRSLQDEIDKQLGLVAGNRKSLAATAVRYQRLQLESTVADKQLAGALASLEDARNEARRKQAYVERIVEPNMPDDALEPRRLRGIFTTFVLGLVAFGILSMLLAGIREHQD